MTLTSLTTTTSSNNVISFLNIYAKLCFGRVLKHSSARLMRVKLFLLIFLTEWWIACSWLSENCLNGCQILGRISVFHTSLLDSEKFTTSLLGSEKFTTSSLLESEKFTTSLLDSEKFTT